ncbi:MAG: PspA/IM30 family protein, partial [Myxococcota bacterium]
MAGIFARLAALIKSNINDLISKAEDPEKMLEQVVLDMNKQLVEAKKLVAVAIADEKRLAKQAEGERAKATEWERRAMMAVRAGDDALAKEALNRKREHDGLANEFQEQWKKQKVQVDQLKMTLRVLNNKIEEAKRKKQVLKARARRARAQQEMADAMGKLNQAGALATYERMEERINQMEAQAEATSELAEEYSGDTLAHKFGQLEASQGADDDLAALKQKMGLAAAPEPETAEPVRVDEEIDLDTSASEQFEQLSTSEQD